MRMMSPFLLKEPPAPEAPSRSPPPVSFFQLLEDGKEVAGLAFAESSFNLVGERHQPHRVLLFEHEIGERAANVEPYPICSTHWRRTHGRADVQEDVASQFVAPGTP